MTRSRKKTDGLTVKEKRILRQELAKHPEITLASPPRKENGMVIFDVVVDVTQHGITAPPTPAASRD